MKKTDILVGAPTRRRILASLSASLALPAVSACARKLPPDLSNGYDFYCQEAPEITEPGQLIGDDGRSHCGWMRKPLLDLNLEDARFYGLPYFQRYRLKKWDMYYVISPTHYLQFLVAWIGYGGFADAAIYDRESRQWLTGSHIRLPRPEFPMMRNSTRGVTEFTSHKLRVRFEVDGEERRIEVRFPGFAGIGLSTDILLRHPADRDSICGVHLTHPRRVHYGEKITSMAATGTWKLGNVERVLDPQNSFGLLDFGRGYYPPKKFWYWATASGHAADGAVVGWNLGHGNNPNETTENALFYNGGIHKVGSVKVSLDFNDYYRPWQVQSNEGRVDLTLTPENVRDNRVDLGLLYSVGQPAMGLFNGYMVLDSGQRIEIKDLFGLFEVVDQTW